MKYIILGIVLGIIWLIIKNAAQKKTSGSAQTAPQAKSAPQPVVAPPGKQAVKKMGVYPTRANGQPLQYFYRFEFEPTPGVDVERDILAGEEKIVQVGYDDETEDVLLVHEGIIFGRIHNAQQMNMVRDYLNRNNPVRDPPRRWKSRKYPLLSRSPDRQRMAGADGRQTAKLQKQQASRFDSRYLSRRRG